MNDEDIPVTSSFIENSYLSYIIPYETNLDLARAFTTVDASKPFPQSIRQRETLFFDETVNVFLLLKTPRLHNDELRCQLRQLSISLEARVVSSVSSNKDSLPVEETIFTGKVKDVSGSFVTFVDHQHDDDFYTVWKQSIFLARPRSRSQSPSIVFSASATVTPAAESSSSQRRDAGYLPSGLTASINLLESFSDDAWLASAKPRLSALRVSRVAPVVKRQGDSAAQVRALQQLRLPVFPALHTRIRFTRPNATPPSLAIVAILEIDFTSHVDSEMLIDEISLVTPDGTVEKLNNEPAMRLPLTCVSHDNVTFLYLITPHPLEGNAPHRTNLGDLEISMKASVQVEANLCVPQLVMAWHAALDFSLPVNPSFAPPLETGIQRSHRPSQLSIGSSNTAVPSLSITTAHPQPLPTAAHPDSLPSLPSQSPSRPEAAIPTQDLGITMSFSSPSTPIRPGDIFSWTVHVVNRSDDKSARPPRKLALIAIPRRRRTDTVVRPLRPPSTASRRRGEPDTADAVVDDNVLHALQRGSALDVADVVCLSADTRVGPLGPGACHVAELQFLALREGVVGVEAIRVVDMVSQEHVDIRDLPVVVVEPAAA
ncbi:hypothetical protein CDD80_7202 [Ophiocordyceps camponoti-rufipedis]|uniref:Trafficking protein particle complex II-specific subunit 65 IgD3 domain-containing protein n=1 Tax=Ophiocordyceps camponoti-rufipedis TaxID=2004952 RepID=A0A2C5YNH0_9HYPO|nr:hypothetical protein CDD80_7202 [Ophiocordyceps camponoti-rufipedis]